MNNKIENPTCVYHEVKAPKGITVSASEADRLYKKGWVDSPAKFGKGIRSKTRRIIKTLSVFCLSHWKWIITTSLVIIGLYLAYLQLTETK